jgi:hypothetical protein
MPTYSPSNVAADAVQETTAASAAAATPATAIPAITIFIVNSSRLFRWFCPTSRSDGAERQVTVNVNNRRGLFVLREG